MSNKFKFFKNKKTRNHPSVEIDSNGSIWINTELTSSPTKKNRYIELRVNPNPSNRKKAYVRKYLRKDPIKTKGQLLEKYHLSEEDLPEIEAYLGIKKASVKPTILGLSSDEPIALTGYIKSKR